MKLAIIKLGARIAYGANDTSGGNGEAKAIISMLQTAGCNCHIYTRCLEKDSFPEGLTFHNFDNGIDTSEMDHDALIVLNGNVNFFGGQEDIPQLTNYFIINNFNGPVFYIYCDPSLELKQIWPSVAKKEWSQFWGESDINITRKDIIYISQPYYIEAVNAIQEKAGIKIKSTHHFPFEKFPCLNEQLPVNLYPQYDLLYGGTMRGNRRVKKMVKFYYGYGEDLNVQMFGKIDKDKLDEVAKKLFPNTRPPEIGGTVNYSDFMHVMNNSYAHVVIGDEWYEGRDMPQRCYESIWSNVVTFIDADLDPRKRVFGSSETCTKFNYVTRRQTVETKLREIKDNPVLRMEILSEQIRTINFDKIKYCEEFVSLLESLIN